MLANWQTWIAALLCLAAAVYIARRAWLTFAGNKSPGCGSGCGSCDAAKTKRGALLTIQPDADRRS